MTKFLPAELLMKQHPDNRLTAARKEATDWWVRLDGQDITPQQYQLFSDWLDSDPLHVQAFDELTQLWGELDAVKPRMILPKVRHPKDTAKQASNWPQGVFSPFAVQGATGLALCCLLFWFSPLGFWLQADFYTGIGEMRSVQLSDGSKVHLNSDSALAVAIDGSSRQLELLKGEALFEVSPDRNRPFQVHAGHGTVTALGTAFNIRLTGERARVTVTEHSVAIKLDQDEQTTKLEEGQQLVFDNRHGIGETQLADTHAVTAWQRGKLVFQNQPLGEVIAELNRYHHGYLMISDAGIAQRRVNGVFRTDDPMAVLDALQTSLQLHSTRLSDYWVLIHR